MMIKFLATLALALAPTGFAFVAPTGKAPSIKPKSSINDQDPVFPNEKKDDKFDMDNILANVPEVSFSFDIETIKDNLMDGTVGERGEAFAAAQFALLGCIVFGGIPFVGDYMMILLGPCLMLAGVLSIILSISDLGSNNLSPWVVPSKDGQLVQDGIFSKLRHPQYAGFLAAMAGFSIVTGSASRLLLTAFLYYVLSEMVENEEKELSKKFPEYEDYKKKVPGKFFPDEIAQQLPWNQE
ncbi:Isoprenylcysteine carboxyl methyltransferase (ICMT) family [Seminavis robusta]|uniref:Isoprenylcysteine carboxyl methyltransferase (ICMT) family n=1 Tax=Seminavis robusta TaxID=568900 RepID=A0A9N8HYA6_9STRA|nr:Isoprenylcysteine carboxyl methyltransferase (ICMT) family [Seminavis robusta]|eukprot:Sro2771_g336740.1 Isoprenylcysteine carboxyl methyltransferase (ICMT) family (240) ;mRNA; f:620-1416